MSAQMKEICNILKNADNEGTNAPYWLILDPRQNMSCDVNVLASQITGIFFSREDAELCLKKRRHHYSERARVYCMSGCYALEYRKLCDELKI